MTRLLLVLSLLVSCHPRVGAPRATCRTVRAETSQGCTIVVGECGGTARTVSVLTTKAGAKRCAERTARTIGRRRVSLMFTSRIGRRVLLVFTVGGKQ